MSHVRDLWTRLVWRCPTAVYAFVPAAIAVGAVLTAGGVLAGVASPYEREMEPIYQLPIAAPLAAQLDFLDEEADRIDAEAEAVRTADAGSEMAQGMQAARLAELDHQLDDLGRQAVVAAERAGLRCETRFGSSVDPLTLGCEGDHLTDAAVWGWLGLLVFVTSGLLLALSAGLVLRRRLLPWGAPRVRLLPAVFTSVAALVLPSVALVGVFCARDAGYPIAIEGGVVHAGSALAVVLFVWGVALLLHALASSTFDVGSMVASIVVLAAILLALISASSVPGAAAAAGASGVALGGGGSVLRRWFPAAGAAVLLGVLLVMGGLGLVAAWARPGPWCWAIVVLLVALVMLPIGPQEQAVRELLPRPSDRTRFGAKSASSEAPAR